jgi:hypothetical protein
MSSPWLLPGIFGASLLAVCGLGYLLIAAFRTWGLAGCWHCGAEKVRRSKSRSSLDTLAGVFFLRPYRCGGCLTRFYGFRTFSFDPRPRIVPPAPRELPPKLPFRIRVKVIVRVPTLTTWESAWEWLTELQDVAEEARFKHPVT